MENTSLLNYLKLILDSFESEQQKEFSKRIQEQEEKHIKQYSDIIENLEQKLFEKAKEGKRKLYVGSFMNLDRDFNYSFNKLVKSKRVANLYNTLVNLDTEIEVIPNMTGNLKKVYDYLKEKGLNPELLKQWFPNAFLEAGKWYLITNRGYKVLFNFSGDYDKYGNPLGYGINHCSNWVDLTTFGWKYNTIALAPKGDVKKALIIEVKRRGFKADAKFINFNGVVQTVFEGLDKSYHVEIIYMDDCFNLWVDAPKKEWSSFGRELSSHEKYHSNPFIFKDGNWVEVIETELELTLDEIAKKFGVDRVKIKK